MSRWLRSVGAAVGVMLLSSCASITVNSLPQPGGSYSDGYDIVMEFANALNLPDRAKVMMDGTTIGVVTGVNLTGDHVDLTSRIDSAVVVPSNVHATMRQATVLGDIYVELERPQADDVLATAVAPQGRIPMAQTSSPPQLEDTIANLANFVGSGSIQRVQNTIIGLNRVTPSDRGELRQIVTRVATDLSDVANNIDVVDKWLEGAAGTADALHGNLSSFSSWVTPIGMIGWDRATQVGVYVGTLLPSIGSVYSSGFWLVPMLNSTAKAMGAVQQTKWAFEGEEYEAWHKLFTNNFLPVDKYPAINITSIVGPDGRELSGNVQDVLRILGATP